MEARARVVYLGIKQLALGIAEKVSEKPTEQRPTSSKVRAGDVKILDAIFLATPSILPAPNDLTKPPRKSCVEREVQAHKTAYTRCMKTDRDPQQ